MNQLLKHPGARARLAAVAGLGFLVAAAACVDVAAALRAHLSADLASTVALQEAQRRLHRHVDSGRPDDLRAALDELAVPLAAARVREAVMTGKTDADALHADLLSARVHPSDVGAVRRLYRVLGATDRLAEVASRREPTDAAARTLALLAMQREAAGTPASGPERRAWHLRLEAAVPEVAAPGMAFADGLDAAGRTVQAAFATAAGLFVVTLAALVLAPSRRRFEPVRAPWERAAVAGGVGLFDWDLAADRLSLDGATLAAQGWGRDAAVPVPVRHVRQVVHPDDLLRVRESVAHARVTRLPWRERFRVLRPDGRELQVEVAGRLVDDPDGVSPHLLGVLRPVSRPSGAPTAVADASRADMLTHVVLELRAPLRAVLAFARALAADGPPRLAASQLHRVEQVLRIGTRLLRRVDDVLGQPAWDAAVTAGSDTPAPRGRVLCIEDNPLHVLVLRQLLAGWPGVELLIADDAETGLMMARTGAPDLVLLDLQLQGTDGIALLRALQSTATSPVVVLSAGGRPSGSDAAVCAGASGVLTTPLAPDQVLDQVRRHLA